MNILINLKVPFFIVYLILTLIINSFLRIHTIVRTRRTNGHDLRFLNRCMDGMDSLYVFNLLCNFYWIVRKTILILTCTEMYGIIAYKLQMICDNVWTTTVRKSSCTDCDSTAVWPRQMVVVIWRMCWRVLIVWWLWYSKRTVVVVWPIICVGRKFVQMADLWLYDSCNYIRQLWMVL